MKFMKECIYNYYIFIILFFSKSEYNPAERYAHIIKTMYMCGFYGTLIPYGYFLTALSLFL